MLGMSQKDSSAIPSQPAPLLVMEERVGKGHKAHPPRITSTASTGRTPGTAAFTSPANYGSSRIRCLARPPVFLTKKSEDLTKAGTFDQTLAIPSLYIPPVSAIRSEATYLKRMSKTSHRIYTSKQWRQDHTFDYGRYCRGDTAPLYRSLHKTDGTQSASVCPADSYGTGEGLFARQRKEYC